MSVRDLLPASLRRWPVALAGLLLTVAAVVQVLTGPGVYWAQVDVRLMLPLTESSPNGLQSPTDSLITTAGVVARVISGSDRLEKASSDNVTIVDRGITRGREVRLPDSGGQWATNFNQPLLDVQVAGRSGDEVLSELERTLAEIDRVLLQEQVDQGVSPSNMIRTRVSPQVPVIRYDEGDRRRAAAATVVLGLGLTGAAVLLVERRQPRAPRPAGRFR